MMSFMDDFAKREHSTKVAQAEEEFIRQAYKNPKQDLGVLSNSIIERFLGGRTEFMRGQENYLIFNDAAAIQKEKERLTKEGISLEQKGSMSKEKNDDIMFNLRLLEKRQRELNIQQSTNQSTAPVSGAARGK